jgi:hypothetical protein
MRRRLIWRAWKPHSEVVMVMTMMMLTRISIKTVDDGQVDFRRRWRRWRRKKK